MSNFLKLTKNLVDICIRFTAQILSNNLTYYTMKTSKKEFCFNSITKITVVLLFIIGSLQMSAIGMSSKASFTTIETHRLWLNVSGPSNTFSQTLMGYRTGATDGVDAGLDGEFFNNGAIALSSLINNDRYAIQFRGLPFSISSMMPLNFVTSISGTFTLAIDHMDGLFLDPTQPIYIYDVDTNNYVNLKITNYSFTATPGTYNNRFRIVYNNTLDVANNNFKVSDLIISNSLDTIIINAGNTVLANVALFSIDGKMLYNNKNVNSNELLIQNIYINHQPMIVKAISDNGIIVSKKWIH